MAATSSSLPVSSRLEEDESLFFTNSSSASYAANIPCLKSEDTDRTYHIKLQRSF